jgi:anti-sigma factor RsiW
MTVLKSAGDATDERALLAHAYFDGELDPVNALAVGRDIAADPQLRAEVERIGALRRAVRERLPIEPLPDGLKAKIEAAIRPQPALSQPSWRSLAASVVCAMVLASGLTWSSLTMRSSGDRISEAIIDGHLRSLMSQRPTDVASSETHTVRPWFNGRTTQAPVVVDLKDEAFPLLGGRVDVIETEPVATLVYSRRQHLISLFALPRSPRAEQGAAGQSIEQPTAGRSVKGYNLVQWTAGNVDYWAASDLNPAELAQFAGLFRSGSTR